MDWSFAETLLTYLKKYKLRTHVTLTDVSEQYTTWAFVSPPKYDSMVAEALGGIKGHFGRDPRLDALGHRGLILSDKFDEFIESIPENISIVPSEIYEVCVHFFLLFFSLFFLCLS